MKQRSAQLSWIGWLVVVGLGTAVALLATLAAVFSVGGFR